MIQRLWLVLAFGGTALVGCSASRDFDAFLASVDLAPPSSIDLTIGVDMAITDDLLTDDALVDPEDFAMAPPADLAASATEDLAAPPPPPDLAGPDLIDPINPFGIHLTDITALALGGKIYGGRSKIDQWGAGSGCAIGDLDGDGRLDLVLARNDDPVSDKPGGPSLMLHNSGPLGGFDAPNFVADPAFSALLPTVRAHGVAMGDYDRDGDLDVFIAAEGRDYLLKNDGSGHFTDVTNSAGVAGRNLDISLGAVWADLNHDGLLDLYVVNWNPVPDKIMDSSRNSLFINQGDGTFVDVSAASGTDNAGCSHTAGMFDFDGNGDLGIYVTNDRFASDGNGAVANILPDAWYRLTSIDDQGVPHFADVAAAQGAVYPRSGMGISVADVDGDLTPDLFLSDIGKKALYLNLTPGSPITEAANAYNLGIRADDAKNLQITWGMRFVDFDRDGNLEVIANNGFFFDPMGCDSFHQVPWYLRQPSPGAPYVVITQSAGLAIPVPGCPNGVGDPDRLANRAVVLGDLDGDGDDDVIFTPYATPFFVYRNDTPRLHHALRIRLMGTVSSPDPIGATLLTTHLSGKKTATFLYAGGDVYSQSDRVLTVGLGDDPGVTRADVRWPSGITQRIDQLPNFAVDQTIVIKEPAWLTVEPRVMKQGDAAPQLVYRPVDEAGQPLGMAGAGKHVSATRSDGVAVKLTDGGDGSYSAPLGHPGAPRRTTLTMIVDGVTLRPRPMMNFK